MGIAEITIELKDLPELKLVGNGSGMELQQNAHPDNDIDAVVFSEEDWASIKSAIDYYFSTQPPTTGED